MKNKLKMNSKDNVTISTAFDLFKRKASVKNLSKYTIQSYQYHFNEFARFIDIEEKMSVIDEDLIDEFIFHLKTKCSMNDTSVASYLRTIRAFLYYCMECGYLSYFKIHLPKTEKQIKETYTDEELLRLLQKPNLNKCTFTEYKTWVFENYLLGTGNRITSALNIRIKDIDFEDGTITIRKTKNRRQQIIPLSKTLANILREYLCHRGGTPDDYVFCNAYGEQGQRRSYQDLVRKYNIARDVNKTSCHLFRHTFAKHWIMSGGDVFRLQRILGHSSLDVTREYVQLFGTDLQDNFDKFNALENIKGAKRTVKKIAL